ncbi:pyruvate dehydrogenase [acetyl-transferring]-phosphatase 1, mitochondrial isoform X2 [Teleopsis dalmanni]|uniref:pyruvate dehydrogenase [acetyl-transferring]-phosphatase 1, mitochondrial isoform X2 n=1 Tax=Teleopsis dalmanni TaxID=139649 RepID=UPI0018CE8A2B|nr:pyruvate dehydrogenase [acetyl-transferring]-phosphatase 1, mitochondrial isoform X2 [Teleopsis dalmanni]
MEIIPTKRGKREAQPQLSPYDVNLLLREHEYTHNFQEDNTIRSYESNQLSSNSPCEDTRTEASFIHKNAFICGIFDGHAGPSCSQVVSKRLLRYIAASVVDRDVLRDQIAKGCTSQSFLRCHNDKVDFVKDIKDIYENSFSSFIATISSQEAESRAAAIENAFVSLDNDLSEEALKQRNMLTMSVAMSGAVACVAYIENLDLHVASVGDCSAVLGVQSAETGQWHAKKLNNEHNVDNIQEVTRILGEHPAEEKDTVIRNDRLLSQLAPLRALGDFRYKWSHEIMDKYVIPTFGPNVVPPNYYTPPYLSGRPEVMHHVLTPNDKFLVIASDGLFDFLSPSQIVTLVGDHLASKKYLEPMKLPPGDVKLGEVSDILGKRKAGRARKPLDQNSATHLIRNALGSTDYGIEFSKISYYLSLPQDVVRLYRDDITVTVIYFNTDFIANSTVKT